MTWCEWYRLCCSGGSGFIFVPFIHSRQSDEYQSQSQLLAVQQQLESTEEMLGLRERELQEAKERVSATTKCEFASLKSLTSFL